LLLNSGKEGRAGKFSLGLPIVDAPGIGSLDYIWSPVEAEVIIPL